ncbi:MAG TPA: TIGR03667 family PPOX class F420-dependent oxidoreductase [Acidimicrobiia bacterium]|nr:TIGR03667 family PPOX class F420-dependent oxidoreductase [Acidimicrobiia bacterium]
MLNDRVKARLEQEMVIWMTTVRSDGQPQTSVVWFLLEGDEILVYSKDGTIRNRNVVENPKVSLNLDGNGRGGAVITIEGTSRIDSEAPEPKDHSAYIEKYQSLIEANGWTPEVFGGDYPVPIRTTIDRVRAW